jgi:hypothetical protein
MLLAKHEKMHISIAGGEPSMSPFLIELVGMFSEAGHTISITTNGYKSPAYWRELAPLATTISFSYHPEYVTERYYENLATAAELSIVGARVMMLASHWEQCVTAYHRLNASDRWVTNPVRVTEWGRHNGTDQYTAEQLEWFKHNGSNKEIPHLLGRRRLVNHSRYFYDDGTDEYNIAAVALVNKGLTNFKGMTCDIGIRSLFINHAGFVKRGNCMAGGYIGNINDPEAIEWPDAPIICPLTLCHCSSDVVINKKSLDPIYRDTIPRINKINKPTAQEVRQRLGHRVVPSIIPG